jgi:hypothetical protein
LAKNTGTYTILSKIPTLAKLSLEDCNMKSLPDGAPCILPSLSNPLLSEGIGELHSLVILTLKDCYNLNIQGAAVVAQLRAQGTCIFT